MEKNGITLEDLATMVKTGFDDVHEKMDKGFGDLSNRMDGLEGRMDGLEGRMDGLEGRMDKLENRMDGLERSVGELKKSHEELKEMVNGIFRVEIYDLKKRVSFIEEKLGIKA